MAVFIPSYDPMRYFIGTCDPVTLSSAIGGHPSLAIIDFEGTLFDTKAAVLHAISETFHSINPLLEVPSKEIIWNYMYDTESVDQFLRCLLKTVAGPGGDSLPDINIWTAVYNSIYSVDSISRIQPYPHAVELLRAFKTAKVPVVIFASQKPRAMVVEVLRAFGMDAEVDSQFMILADTGMKKVPPKPDPASYWDYKLNSFLPLVGRSARDILVIGDTDRDIIYANNIRGRAIWVAHGYGSAGGCVAYMHTIFNDLRDLEDWVQGGFL